MASCQLPHHCQILPSFIPCLDLELCLDPLLLSTVIMAFGLANFVGLQRYLLLHLCRLCPQQTNGLADAIQKQCNKLLGGFEQLDNIKS